MLLLAENVERKKNTSLPSVVQLKFARTREGPKVSGLTKFLR